MVAMAFDDGISPILNFGRKGRTKAVLLQQFKCALSAAIFDLASICVCQPRRKSFVCRQIISPIELDNNSAFVGPYIVGCRFGYDCFGQFAWNAYPAWLNGWQWHFFRRMKVVVDISLVTFCSSIMVT